MNLQFAKLLEIMPDLNLMLLALSAMNKMNSLGSLKKGEGRGLGICPSRAPFQIYLILGNPDLV